MRVSDDIFCYFFEHIHYIFKNLSSIRSNGTDSLFDCQSIIRVSAF